jgi:hypothetical protein
MGGFVAPFAGGPLSAARDFFLSNPPSPEVVGLAATALLFPNESEREEMGKEVSFFEFSL